MDPLSGTASIIGVISLAIQLGQSALKVKRFLDTISNVPSEVTRLKDIIFHLHFIADNVKSLLDRQKQLDGEDIPNPSGIYHALKTCQNKLDLIKGALKGSGQIQKGGGLARSWTQFRLACKKEHIEKLESQLELAISFLNATLIMNLIQSKATLGSDIRAIAQQQGFIYREIVHMKHDFAHWPGEQRAATSSAVTPIIYSPPKASVLKAWPYGYGLNIQYCKLGGKNKKYSLILQVKIFKSQVIVAQLSGPFFGVGSSLAFNMSIRNLIPDDAAILEACRSGDCEQVRDLFNLGTARPNDMTPNNETPLSGGFEEVVQLLLREGADPNLPCGEFQTSPLQLAVLCEKLNVVRMLVRHRADLEYVSTRGWSVLHHLFERGKSTTNTEYFLVFMDCLSFDDVKDSEGWTALHRCAAFGTAEDVHFLRHLGVSRCLDRYITSWGWSPIHVAALMNNVSTLEALTNLPKIQPTEQKLSKQNADVLHAVDFHGWTPMHLAAHRHAKDTMKWLLRSGADPHRRTYRTAGWFPPGHEGEAFEVGDLAKMSGKELLEAFVEVLREVGYDITTDGEDIYWPFDGVSLR